jgi:hypothetical protein
MQCGLIYNNVMNGLYRVECNITSRTVDPYGCGSIRLELWLGWQGVELSTGVLVQPWKDAIK